MGKRVSDMERKMESEALKGREGRGYDIDGKEDDGGVWKEERKRENESEEKRYGMDCEADIGEERER